MVAPSNRAVKSIEHCDLAFQMAVGGILYGSYIEWSRRLDHPVSPTLPLDHPVSPTLPLDHPVSPGATLSPSSGQDVVTGDNVVSNNGLASMAMARSCISATTLASSEIMKDKGTSVSLVCGVLQVPPCKIGDET